MYPMRLPSRFIPQRASSRLGWLGSLLMVAVLVGFVYFIYFSPQVGRYITASIICSASGYAWVVNKRTKRRFRLLAGSGDGGSICEFARIFNAWKTDTWVIRAAHQEFQTFLHSCLPDFPISASDSRLVDLEFDLDDVEDLLRDVAKRSSRSLGEIAQWHDEDKSGPELATVPVRAQEWPSKMASNVEWRL